MRRHLTTLVATALVCAGIWIMVTDASRRILPVGLVGLGCLMLDPVRATAAITTLGDAWRKR